MLSKGKIEAIMAISKKLSLSFILVFGVVAQSFSGSALPAFAATCVVGPSADLKGCDLRAENMTGVSLAGANLTGANLQGAVLDSTDLTGAILTGVKSGNVSGTPTALPANWNLVGGYLLGPGASLQQANLKGLVLAGFDLTGADLSYANVKGADLSDTILTSANLTGIVSGSIIGFPALPSGWQATDVGGYLIGRSADLTGADFRNANLSGFDLSGHDLTGANFGGANLAGTDMTSTILNGVVSGAVTGKPLLSTGTVVAAGYLVGPNVNLNNADLSGADLSGANIYGANLDQTNLSQAKMAGVASGRIVGTPQLSAGWQLMNGYLVGPEADLTGADLAGVSFKDVDVSNIDLSGAILDNITSGGVVGNPVLGSGWVLTAGYLAGPKADLSGANLASADLTGANLTGANLAGADVTGALMSRVTLTGVKSGGLTGMPTLAAKWHVFASYLVGPGADLTGADLSNQNFNGLDLEAANFSGDNLSGTTLVAANLRAANLSNADLTDADLTDATLIGVTSGSLIGLPKLTAPWQLSSTGYLVGPGASLDGADLSKQDLSRTDISGASFYGADLSDTDLSFTTLDNCELRLANLSGTNIANASLIGATSGDIIGAPKLSADQTLVGGYLLAQGVNLASADLSFQDLSALNLSGVNFVGANLSSTNFSSSNLSGADLTDATIDQAIFTGTNLTGLTSSGIIGAPKTLPAKWSLIDGSLLKELSSTPKPTFTGGNTVGSKLTASFVAWSDGAVVEIQWLRDGLVIADAVGNSYTLTSADVGHTISIAATGSAPGFIATTVNSANSIVANVAHPAAMTKAATPKISGKLKAAAAVKAVTAAWVKGAKISYQWLLDGKKIKGATSGSYKIAKTAKGHKLSLTVTQSAAGYATTSKTTKPAKVG